ncbi:MAG TPA: hypothetical protein VFF00_07655 [Candidatus Elarobacter sp.]|nr:hypothetical protein [Dongiaceae bacterium]HZW53894.1 hypothetical protein [Candidatus Elarobacter sp.]
MIAPLLALLLALGDAPVAADVISHLGPTPPPHGYPEIKAVSISSTDMRAGRPVHGTVETSLNVHYVEARIDYRNVALHEDAPGRFSLTYTVPWWLPPWLRRRYTLQVIARSVDGAEAMRAIPIIVR